MKYLIKNINDVNDADINNFVLNSNDKLKYNKILNKKRKKQFIIGRMLLSELLITEYNKKYIDIPIIFNKNGKPYLKNNNIYFNISHSNDYVICAISDKNIGVDIEKIKSVNKNSVKFYAKEKEVEYICNNDIDFNRRAICIYSLKEAYYKMNGFDIKNMFKEEYIITQNNIICSDKNVICYSLNIIPNYIISIVIKK